MTREGVIASRIAKPDNEKAHGLRRSFICFYFLENVKYISHKFSKYNNVIIIINQKTHDVNQKSAVERKKSKKNQKNIANPLKKYSKVWYNNR